MEAEAGATRPPAQEPRKLEAAGRTLPSPEPPEGGGPVAPGYTVRGTPLHGSRLVLSPRTHTRALSSDTSGHIKIQWSPAWKGRLPTPCPWPGH